MIQRVIEIAREVVAARGSVRPAGVLQASAPADAMLASAPGYPMVTNPGQLKRCQNCDQLARLYDVNGRHLCAACAQASKGKR